jgi:hypothetical protein
MAVIFPLFLDCAQNDAFDEEALQEGIYEQNRQGADKDL